MKNKIQTLLLVGALLFCSPLFALSLEDAKSRGLVGETASGYLAARNAAGDVKSLVASINAKRQAHYREISGRNGTPLGTVEKIAGKKLIERAGKGEYYQQGGAWKRR
uniref:DUF1318 domain-containing protein n=1 Tax=Candidatus Kentrum sp. DK TaxID=2126562 RepID=A0A450TIB5_9GAMM|nr:MAG: hypothetical protein BECKDK2373B_GA0170837_11823 [Candidatus Kentron sp. DK]